MNLLIGAILAFIVTAITSWIIWRIRRMSTFQRYGIPGPKPNFITGNMRDFHEKRKSCTDDWLEKYGKIFGFFLGAKAYMFCYDVELIKLMQVKEFKKFANKDLMLPDAGIPHRLSFQFLELQNDDKWKNMRNVLSSSFSSGKIKMMSTLMDEPIKTFIKNIKMKKGEYFNMVECFRNLTFDIICRSAFGVTTNVQNNETNKFIESALSAFDVDSSDFLSTISICFPEFEPLPSYFRQLLDALKHFMNFPSVRVVFDTCSQIIESRQKSSYHPPDLLQSVIDGKDESKDENMRLTNDSVLANTMAFMIAGHDTTSGTLSWCIHYLSHYPEVQERVREEINEHIKISEDIQYADLLNLKYMDQVISETLRLSPLTLITVNRICAEDFKFKELTVPKGTIVLVPVPNLQRDPTYWQDPDKFNPDRFSSENRANIDSTIYQPFGAGPRHCIGMRLAQAVMKLVLANLIRSFKLEPDPDKEMEVEHTLFIIRPKNGVIVKAIPISS